MIALVIANVNLLLTFWGPESIQGRLKTAAQFTPMINKLLSKDQRFQGVECGFTTSRGGHLLVQGIVNAESDLSALRETIRLSKPPMDVHFRIEGNGSKQTLRPILTSP